MNAFSLQSRSTGLAILAVFNALVIGGCSNTEEKGPSYADLVVIYNEEVESLDRLENKKRRLIAEYEEKNAPRTDGTTEALAAILDATKNARDKQSTDAPIVDPDQALDKAIADAEKLGDQLLDSAAKGLDKDSKPVVYSEEFKQQLAALDKEIESQRARVERAHQARDEAEAEKSR